MKNIVALHMTSHPAGRSEQEGVVSRYLESLRLRNLRPQTIYNRQCALARLRRWANGPILYLLEDELQKWRTKRADDIGAEPLRTELSHLRQFYRWVQREGYRSDDPTLRLELPRVARRMPRPIRDAQLAEAMAEADLMTCAILALAAFAGLRAWEIAGLDWSDVDLESSRRTIYIRDGKGGHERVVSVSSVLATCLERLPMRRGPVIRRLDGKSGPNKAHRISSRANDYLHSIGVVETLHQCRHRFGTRMYEECQDLRAVQEAMGHAHPSATAGYAAASSRVARDAIEAAGALDTGAA